MSDVSVLIPWRTSCPQRERVWRHLERRWRAALPDAELILGTCASAEWSKGEAVADALERAHGSVLVITDADVWSDRIGHAVNLVRDGGARWCVPNYEVCRFDQAATEKILDGAEPADLAASEPWDRKPYLGVLGGGAVVVPTDTYRRVPIDPRFLGWGGEDIAWGFALTACAGAERRLRGPLWHLWHPPERHASRTGTEQNTRLHRRYQKARKRPTVMRALLSEVIDAPSARHL